MTDAYKERKNMQGDQIYARVLTKMFMHARDRQLWSKMRLRYQNWTMEAALTATRAGCYSERERETPLDGIVAPNRRNAQLKRSLTGRVERCRQTSVQSSSDSMSPHFRSSTISFFINQVCSRLDFISFWCHYLLFMHIDL